MPAGKSRDWWLVKAPVGVHSQPCHELGAALHAEFPVGGNELAFVGFRAFAQAGGDGFFGFAGADGADDLLPFSLL